MFGTMDSTSYNIMEQAFIDAYQLAGAILLGIGCFYAFRFFGSKGDTKETELK